jgi:hypothetical protein
MVKNVCLVLSLFILVSCGKDSENGLSIQDPPVLQELGTPNVGIDFTDIDPGLACANGGMSIFSFYDSNSDRLFQSDEIIIKTKAICHGLNGTNGVNGTNASLSLESFLASATCPGGGVKISGSASVSVEVCNGVNGLNGQQGIQGVQGIPGMAGATGATGETGAAGTNATQVTPVKFCANDNSAFPEYGLLIGEELFAVFWGPTPGTPSVSQAFLSKLVAGNYMSTGGNNCLFAVP